MKLKCLALAAAIAAVPAVAPTASLNSAKSIRGSTCGIGAMIFQETAVAAAISNIIWDLGTTAVTSNVSSPESCAGKRVQSAMYINTTYAKLETETAMRLGRLLTGLANVMGCKAEAREPLFARVRLDMASTMAKPGYADLEKTKRPKPTSTSSTTPPKRLSPDSAPTIRPGGKRYRPAVSYHAPSSSVPLRLPDFHGRCCLGRQQCSGESCG